MTDRDGSKDSQPFHLILLAKDWTGYQNLCRLVTDAHIDGYYYKPRIDRDHLAQHSEGLIGLSACLNGEIPRALETDDWDSARTHRRRVHGHLRHGQLLPRAPGPRHPGAARAQRASSFGWRPRSGLPLVATNDLHYVHREQHEAHDALLCVGTGVQR